ncbi:MAG: lipid-A-disaccharide synthase [Bacteroidales bacterium]|nr:lipid-A-disaccharide synthase [Bacteroidales bacterium]
MKYFLSAGEASGDIHGAPLMRALRRLDPQAEFMFLGGDEMTAAAREGDGSAAPLIHYRDMAYMAFSEVLRHLGKIFGNLRVAKESLGAWRPDALILIDYPSFNLKLAEHAASLGIPVYYYISPKVWAWKEWRVKKIRRLCRKVLSILPFEVDFFRKHGMEVEYVGNPSVEEVEQREAALPRRDEFIGIHELDPSRPILALVPGSRRGEIRNNLPIMDAVARRFPSMQPVVAGAPAIEPEFYRGYTGYPVVEGCTFELIRNSACALVTSGTATLETALLGTPQVVCYRANGSRLSYNIMKRLIKCPWVSLPNLIADKEIVPEMLVHLCTVDGVAEQLAAIVPGAPGRDEMLRGYARMRGRLGTFDAPLRAAEIIVSDLRAG